MRGLAVRGGLRARRVEDRGNAETEEGDTAPPPRLAVAEVDTATCLPYQGPECGACAGSCPVPGALVWELEKPRIDSGHCTGCALCREACIVEPKAIQIRSLYTAGRGPSQDEQTSESGFRQLP